MTTRHRHVAVLVALAGFSALPARALTPPPADEQPARNQLRQAEQDRAAQMRAQRDAAARAQAAAAQAIQLTDSRIAAAARLRDAEDATAAAAARVADLAGRERAARARLDDQARAFAPLLPVIERLSLYPAETLLAVPLPPDQALRGMAVLGGVSRAIAAQAARLRAEQDEVAALHARLDAEMQGLAAARAAQAAQAAALDQQIAAAEARHSAAEDAAADAARRAAADAARAGSLRAAIARIEADQREAEARARQAAEAAARLPRDPAATAAVPDDPPVRDQRDVSARPAEAGIGATRGPMTAPVAGTVVRAFGAADEAGPTSGLSYQAPPAARVVAPCGGRIVFSGPFRSFGKLLIIDCGAGTHFVLAGLERLDAAVGRAVRPGEPIGVMPDWDPRAGGGHPSLYVELRQHGQPVDPAPFLRTKS